MNKDTLLEAFARYQQRLAETRPQEVYKWIATKHFLDTFDLNAANLGANIDEALSEASNLLTGGSWFPKGMLKWFADSCPDETRAALTRLFDEDIDLKQRMVDFEKWAKKTLDAVNEPAIQKGENPAKNHFQDSRSMSVYLSFHDAGEHYLYKTTMYTFVAKVLGLKHPGNKFDKVIAYRKMCEEILAYLQSERPDLIAASDATLSDELRAVDPNHHLLVQDIVYFMSTYDRESYEGDGSGASGSDALGDAGVEKVRYWLYAPGEDAHMWDEFYERGVMGLGWHEVGDLDAFASKEDIRLKLQETFGDNTSQKVSALALWQYVHEIKPGDVVFAKKGRTEIVGRGMVTGDYEYDEEGGHYPNLREVEWTHRGHWVMDDMFAMKTLTDITDYTDLVAKISACFEGKEEDPVEDEPVMTYPAYDKVRFLEEAYMSEEEYDTLVGVLRSKKNIILQGAPGVGKTFIAKRLAYSMMGVKEPERVQMVQFHQSYSYEDFIEGFRPSATGFDLVKGGFYTFCKKAQDDTDNDYFFIIDEINRGNLSKIFGELFMLIENDKRGPKNKLQLLYSRELFHVPGNVYLIGMMNTADRSLAMLDYALRRRFAFFDLKPGFDSDGFVAYRDGLGSAKLDELLACVVRLNEAIAGDETLGDGFCIGHSYFCGMKAEDVTDAKLSAIVEYELIPMLREYWFDEPSKVREWANALRRTIK